MLYKSLVALLLVSAVPALDVKVSGIEYNKIDIDINRNVYVVRYDWKNQDGNTVKDGIDLRVVHNPDAKVSLESVLHEWDAVKNRFGDFKWTAEGDLHKAKLSEHVTIIVRQIVGNPQIFIIAECVGVSPEYISAKQKLIQSMTVKVE
jgi:hypothetical protein